MQLNDCYRSAVVKGVFRPEVQPLTLLYTILAERYPFYIPFIEKSYPFHIAILGSLVLVFMKCLINWTYTTLRVACIADETKPWYSPSANQRPLACSTPRVLPRFFIIGSNWLLHMAVLSCTVIG